MRTEIGYGLPVVLMDIGFFHSGVVKVHFDTQLAPLQWLKLSTPIEER